MTRRAPPIAEIKNVTAWRGSTRVFHGLSLEIHPGASTVILGPNGSGKTTLLKLLSREIYPEPRDETRLRLFGEDRWNVWELRTRLGMVSSDLQEAYDSRATGRDVVLSGYYATPGARPHHRFDEEERKRAHQVMEELGVTELGAKRYGEMSTGEQRRFLLARALVHDPEVLVLDEPTSGLDPQACFQYVETIRSLIRAGTTVVLVTHHIHEIPPEVQRAVLLREGQVIGDGRKKEVLTSARVTELFGTPMKVLSSNGYLQVIPARHPSGNLHDASSPGDRVQGNRGLG